MYACYRFQYRFHEGTILINWVSLISQAKQDAGMDDAAEHAKHVAWHLSLDPMLHVEAKNLGFINTCLGNLM